MIASKLKSFFKETFFFWLFWIISISVFSIWLIGFYPGIMTADSFDQWQQSSTLIFNNWHPLISTLYILGLREIFNSPATIAITQILATSTIFSYIFYYFLQKKANKFLIAGLFVVFITSIPIGTYNITLWKDIPFSLSLVFLSFLISKSFFERNLSNPILIVILTIVVCFFRYNGFFNLIIIPLWLIFLSKKIKPITIYLIISITALLSIFNLIVLPRILDSGQLPIWLSNGTIYYETVSFLRPLPMWTYIPRVSPETIEAIKKIMPIENLIKNFDPRSADKIFFSKEINSTAFNDPQNWNIIRHEFWSYNLITNLNFFLGDRVTLFLTNTLGYGPIVATDIGENNLDLKSTPISNWLHNILLKIIQGSTMPGIILHTIWNSLFAILVLIFVFIQSIYKKYLASLIFTTIILSNVCALALVNIAGDGRYYYYAYLSFFAIIPFYYLERKTVISPSK